MCLWFLACNADNRVAIALDKGVPALVKLLKHPETKVRKVMLRFKSSNSLYPHPLPPVVLGVPPLPPFSLVLIHSLHPPPFPQAACGALSKLALLEENRNEIHKCQGTSRMLEMMKDPNGLEREVAVSALTNLALSNHLRLAIGNSGGVPPIVAFLNGTDSAKTSASNAIANLVCTPSVKVRTSWHSLPSPSREVQGDTLLAVTRAAQAADVLLAGPGGL